MKITSNGIYGKHSRILLTESFKEKIQFLDNKTKAAINTFVRRIKHSGNLRFSYAAFKSIKVEENIYMYKIGMHRLFYSIQEDSQGNNFIVLLDITNSGMYKYSSQGAH